MGSLHTKVMGNDVAVAAGSSHGHLQLNTFRPVVGYCVLQSVRLLTDGANCFARNCVSGITPNYSTLSHHIAGCLMIATALAPMLGYYPVAQVS